MADPDHTPTMDDWDRWTVRVYRGSLLVASLAVLAAAGLLWMGAPTLAAHRIAVGAAGVGAVMVHLYAKRVRGAVALLAVLGLAVGTLDGLGGAAGRGLVYAVLGVLAVKEWFCFRIPGLRAVPLLLAGGVLIEAFGPARPAAVCWGLSGSLLVWLALAKLRMPLGHDIGRRDAYEL